MKTIDKYIIEKLIIDKNTGLDRDSSLDWDARTFKPYDIIYSNPNISRGVNKPGKPGIPSFYKVISNNKKKLEIAHLGTKYVSGNRNGGEAVPENEKEIIGNPVKISIDKNGFAIYGANVLYLWDGKPEKFYC